MAMAGGRESEIKRQFMVLLGVDKNNDQYYEKACVNNVRCTCTEEAIIGSTVLRPWRTRCYSQKPVHSAGLRFNVCT